MWVVNSSAPLLPFPNQSPFARLSLPSTVPAALSRAREKRAPLTAPGVRAGCPYQEACSDIALPDCLTLAAQPAQP